MPNKAFLEITNACNLSCSFCHGTKRPIRYMNRAEFTNAATQIRPFADYLYFHLMGEPLLHPLLGDFLAIAGELGFRVILTTNGTLLDKRRDVLLSAPALHKVSISVHSLELETGAGHTDPETYLQSCFRFCTEAAERGIIAVLRLWNIGAARTENEWILGRMHQYFDGCETAPSQEPWKPIYSGYKIKDRIFLEWGERFDWPDVEGETVSVSHGCYGLQDQFGVLTDGTVVPCCLDADGVMGLGNLFAVPLAEILRCPRAMAIRHGFETKTVTEKLCRTCGYAKGKGYR